MKCIKCKRDECIEVTKTRFLISRGLEFEVEGLKNWLCKSCGAEFESAPQANVNAGLIKSVFLRKRKQAKEALGLLSGAEIKSIRERYSLTQAEAARMFGGGVRAFSKYENEEIVQTESMDRLLRGAQEFQELAVWLAERQGVELAPRLAHQHSKTEFVLSRPQKTPPSLTAILKCVLTPVITAGGAESSTIRPKVVPVTSGVTPKFEWCLG